MSSINNIIVCAAAVQWNNLCFNPTRLTAPKIWKSCPEKLLFFLSWTRTFLIYRDPTASGFRGLPPCATSEKPDCDWSNQMQSAWSTIVCGCLVTPLTRVNERRVIADFTITSSLLVTFAGCLHQVTILAKKIAGFQEESHWETIWSRSRHQSCERAFIDQTKGEDRVCA